MIGPVGTFRSARSVEPAMRGRIGVGLLIVVALTMAGCGRLQQRRSGPVEYSRGPDDLVLRVEETGIFGPEAWILRSLPFFSLYGDGQMIAAGPRDETYPPPLLQPLTVQQLFEEGMQAILAAADDAGLLGPDRELSGEGLGTDAGYVVFTVDAAGRRHEVSVYGFYDDPGSAPGGERDDREALLEFVDRLANLEEWLPAGSVGPKEPYVPDRLRIHTGPHSMEFLPPVFEDFPDPPPEGLPEIEWPLETPIPEFGVSEMGLSPIPSQRCGVVEGRQLRAFLAAAEGASEYTPWVSGGERFGVIVRPLFPADPDCQ
jgi:hypothetical protein